MLLPLTVSVPKAPSRACRYLHWRNNRFSGPQKNILSIKLTLTAKWHLALSQAAIPTGFPCCTVVFIKFSFIFLNLRTNGYKCSTSTIQYCSYFTASHILMFFLGERGEKIRVCIILNKLESPYLV